MEIALSAYLSSMVVIAFLIWVKKPWANNLIIFTQAFKVIALIVFIIMAMMIKF
jgi:hypothetical protein